MNMHGRGPFAQSARERGRLRLDLLDDAPRAPGSTIPNARCRRSSRAISLRDIVFDRRRPRLPSASRRRRHPPPPPLAAGSRSSRRLPGPRARIGPAARSASPRSSPALPSHPRRVARRSPSTGRRAGARDRSRSGGLRPDRRDRAAHLLEPLQRAARLALRAGELLLELPAARVDPRLLRQLAPRAPRAPSPRPRAGCAR